MPLTRFIQIILFIPWGDAEQLLLPVLHLSKWECFVLFLGNDLTLSVVVKWGNMEYLGNSY